LKDKQTKRLKQGVALKGHNTTGTPCSVSHPTAHAPGRRRADRPCARPARRQRCIWRQMPASKTILAH